MRGVYVTLLVTTIIWFVSSDIVTTPSCIEIGGDVVIGFENVDAAMDNDWIGLFREEDVVDDAVPGMPTLHPLNWVFSCNSRAHCEFPAERGPVLISRPKINLNIDDSDSSWVAVLARFTGVPPYPVVGKSAPFRVTKNCTVSDDPPTFTVSDDLPTFSPTKPQQTEFPTSSTIRPTSLSPTKPPTSSPIRPPTTPPTRLPTLLPTRLPTHLPTSLSTPLPTEISTSLPTGLSTPLPTRLPTPLPTKLSTHLPTELSTPLPTRISTPLPTMLSNQLPTEIYLLPTDIPTSQPSEFPTSLTIRPTSLSPTKPQTTSPIKPPTTPPMRLPTLLPTMPTEILPTKLPTTLSTPLPSFVETTNPTINFPTLEPSKKPTKRPTRKPTKLPTPFPTNEPTPTLLKPRLMTNKKLYMFQESIQVIFDTENPRQGDWIGIYQASAPLNNLRDALFWMWNCDNANQNPDCGVRASGTVTFSEDKDIDWAMQWPPVPGEYKAILLRRDNDDPWEAVHVSAVFAVSVPTELNAESVVIVRKELEVLVENDIKLAAKFVRLGFHDCVGGCDGCVDLDEIKNRGLEIPLDALDPIVEKYSHILSRADIWAMSTLVGADLSQPSDEFQVEFAFDGYGRLNCEDIHDKCFNKNNEEVPCDARHGPAHFIPGVNINTNDIFAFFRREFDFNQREAVAIMGAHTIGELARKNSGINGEHGWLLKNRVLDNEYYIELVGGRSVNSPLDSLINDAPNWVRHFESNIDLDEFDDNFIWLGTPNGLDGEIIIMLNADIALVRDLNDRNMKPNGEVSCSFVEREFTPAPVCPHARGALQEAARYRFDNDVWLEDFEVTCKKMMRNGYILTNDDCLDRNLCRLELK